MALRTRFHARPGQDDNFDTLTPDAIRGFIDQILGMVAAIVVPVTCISLVVGGIVIMNIMLVSVTERTREIGVRKALGARHGDVMMQILIEAVVLAIVGGAMGVAIGAAGDRAAGQRLRSLAAHHPGLRGALAGGLEHRGRRFGLVSGLARGQTRSGGGVACGVNREYQRHRKHEMAIGACGRTASARCSPFSESSSASPPW